MRCFAFWPVFLLERGLFAAGCVLALPGLLVIILAAMIEDRRKGRL